VLDAEFEHGGAGRARLAAFPAIRAAAS
jgi:hypothetical protein